MVQPNPKLLSQTLLIATRLQWSHQFERLKTLRLALDPFRLEWEGETFGQCELVGYWCKELCPLRELEGATLGKKGVERVAKPSPLPMEGLSAVVNPKPMEDKTERKLDF